jgi:glycosyltransferase involved in cell wall biosynthesis
MAASWISGLRVGYLSAAPRVSTRDDAEASGPRTHILGTIRGLRDAGASVAPFIVGDHMPRRLRARSEKALRRGVATTLVADVARIGLGALNARRAYRELGADVDLVYERHATLQSLGWIFRRHEVPWILETNAPFFYEAKSERKSLVLDRLARRRELQAYRQCDVLVCISRDLRDILVAAGIDAGKIAVVPNGVDDVRFDPRACAGMPRWFPGFTVGFAGAIIEWQGLDLLLEAVAAVRAAGADVSVVIAGDGPFREACEALAVRLGLARHVRFTGRVAGTAVPSLLAGVDCGFSGQRVLKIGRMYHSPLKLYEYMAMARPPIASRFDDAMQAVDDRVSGFLFAPGDRADLERALRDAVAAGPRLPEMGRAARQRVLDRYTWRARIDGLFRAVEPRLRPRVKTWRG